MPMTLRRITIAIIPVLLFILALALSLHSTVATANTIIGHGYAVPTGTHPATTVTVYDKASMTILGTTTTYPDGSYALTFYPVGIENQNQQGLSGMLFRNPFQDKLEISVSVMVTGNYEVQVFDEGASTLLSKSILLQSGKNMIQLSGLGAGGLKTIQVSGCGQKLAFKAIQSSSGASSPSVDVTHSSAPVLKRSASSDSLLVSFVPPSGFIGMDTTVAFQTQEVNYTLQQIPNYVINTTFKPFDVNGNPANITITAHWADGTIGNYSPNANNEIVIQKNLYTSSATATLELDSVTYVNNQNYLALLMGRRIHQAIEDSNLFQSPKEWNSPPQPVVVDMSNPNINGKVIYNYVIPKYEPDETKPGDSIRMDSPTVTQMMTSRPGAGFMTHRYIPIPDPTKQPFYQFRLAFNESDNSTISQALIDKMNNMNNLVMGMSPIPNTNDTIFVPRVDYVVNTSADPIYSQRVTSNEQQNDQFVRLCYFNDNPGDGVLYKSTYTQNGASRASFGYSYNNTGDSDGIVFAECYKANTTTSDPQGNSSSGYIWSTTLNGPSRLAYTMARAEALLNLNTKY